VDAVHHDDHACGQALTVEGLLFSGIPVELQQGGEEFLDRWDRKLLFPHSGDLANRAQEPYRHLLFISQGWETLQAPIAEQSP